MIRGDGNNGTLGPTIWFFCLCVFYLLPVVVLYHWIGWWAWIAGTGFWFTVFHAYRIVADKKEKK